MSLVYLFVFKVYQVVLDKQLICSSLGKTNSPAFSILQLSVVFCLVLFLLSMFRSYFAYWHTNLAAITLLCKHC